MATKRRGGADDPNKQMVGEMTKTELVSLISECLKPVNETVNSLKREVASLSANVDKLTNELLVKDKKIEELQERLEECEQYARRNCLRIFGVQEVPKEDTRLQVLQVAKKIGANIEIAQIDRAHRVGKFGAKSRPIIVKFIGYTPRRAMFSAKKALKGTGITVREDLTKQRLDVLKQAAEAYCERNVWSHDGVIMVKIGDHRPFRLKSASDLDNLITRHPPQE